MVDENLNKPKDLDIKNEKEAKLSEVNGEIALLNKEDRLYNENLEKLNKRKAEINSYYDNLSKESKKLDEVDAEDGAAIPTEEVVTEEVKPSEIKVGSLVKWDVFGNEETGDWNVVNETTTRGGEPAVTLSKTYIEDSTNLILKYQMQNNIE